MSFPTGEDPSSNIKRGQFYQLLVRQFYPNNNINAGQDSDYVALAILANAGVIAATPQSLPNTSEYLAASLSSKEAIETVAKLVDCKGRPGNLAKQSKALVMRTTKQAKQLFVQPAYAAEPLSEVTPLSYLDAAQIVLSASDGIK